MTALAWLLVAVAVLCWPASPMRSVVPSRGRRRARRLVPGGRPSVAQPQVAGIGALAVGGLAVAVLGWPALPVAILTAPLTMRFVDRVATRASPAHDPDLPLVLDLAAAALRSGQPLSRALRLSAPLAPGVGAAVERVAGLLELGTDPERAWAGAEVAALGPIAAAARRSADSGVRLAAGFEQVADDLRRAARAAAVARGERAGVLAMAPLGLCFLPAFVCLGVVPTVVGIAGSAFTGLR